MMVQLDAEGFGESPDVRLRASLMPTPSAIAKHHQHIAWEGHDENKSTTEYRVMR